MTKAGKTSDMTKKGWLPLAVVALLSTAQAQSSVIKFTPSKDGKGFFGKDAEALYSITMKAATVSEPVFQWQYIRNTPDAALIFCKEMTYLGIKEGSVVIGYKDWSAELEDQYLELSKDAAGNLAPSATFLCAVGKVYQEYGSDLLYLPKDAPVALPDRLFGHQLTLKTGPNYTLVPSFK